jgi:hypothetical protein
VILDGLECSPIIIDIDDDGMQEILAGDNYTPGSFYAYEGDGSAVTNWPIATTAATMVNSAAAADVDQDGDIEIALIVNDGTVNLWTLENVPYRGYLTEWRTGFHDNWNTGWLHPKPPENIRVYMAPPPYVHIAWSPNSEPDLAGYNVYRSFVSGGPYTKVNDSLVTDTIYFDYDAYLDTIYYYCASALTKGMAESRLSEEDSIIACIEEQAQNTSGDYQVFPNPCSHYVSFECPSTVHSHIIIYDVKGSCVKILEGNGTLIWKPSIECAQGVYFARIEQSSTITYEKIIRLK